MAVSESRGYTYDVFINFRGKDTRLGFVGNLYKGLKERGVKTFFDEKLMRGEEITASVVNAIEHSKLFIIVFSENYAFSSYCLDELVHILKFAEDNRRLVIPIFYHVDPSDVRNQTGIYGEALDKHDSKSEKVINWRKALRQAAKLSGRNFKHGDGYEYVFIEKIVEDVSKKIIPSVADRFVGLHRRIQQVKGLLDATSDDGVHTVGICGIGGVGKTTLARAVYDTVAIRFDASCFLHKKSEIGSGRLQQTLLLFVYGDNDIPFSGVTQGISPTNQRLSNKKVLLVLDDVTESKQLQALVEILHWFGPGSRVIITARDQQLLRTQGVENTYEVERLTDAESLELLCWKAFKTNRVHPDFIGIMLRARTYAAGIPLVLEVIGSILCGKTREECQYTLDLYEHIPDKHILKVLKISFDALNELQKEVFLAIVCFFIGSESAKIENKLSALLDGYCFKPHIESLVEKSLIKIDEHSHVKMHDLIQQMGIEVYQRESATYLRKLTRLWSTWDNVSEENKEGASYKKLRH